MKNRHSIVFILSMGMLGLLAGCTTDGDTSDSQPKTQHELRVSLGSHRFDEMPTRSLPANFSEYNHAEALAPISQIQGYLTYTDNGQPAQMPCTFNYANQPAAHLWTSRVALQDADYYLYGYMPKDVVGSDITVSPHGATFSEGAVMTLKNLNAVTPDDVCVIVGVGQYTTLGSLPDMSGKLGQFHFNSRAGNGDYLYLLVDHIYAGMQFNMKLDTNYDQLRKIMVKSMTMTPAVSSGEAVETVDAVVTLTATTGTNPLTSVAFTPNKTNPSPRPAVLYEGEGKFLTTSDQSFLACLCPTTTSSGGKYILETIYDVYDKKGGDDGQGRLIRQNERVQNVITLSAALGAGEIYTVNITVQPTYLYMLSDPDLDNPTFKVN